MARVIFHIDMNAYFASVATAMRPELEDVPLVVSGSLAPHGIICSANYLAREKGVRSATRNEDALKRCPELVIVETDFAAYQRYTRKFFDIIRSYSPYLEPASIDECYVDVSEVIKQYKRPLDLAWIIQQRIYTELNLQCSIGVASNKFLAKMASDQKKPMGIVVIRNRELEEKIWPLSIREMYGIGSKTANKLIELGITTIKDLTLDHHQQNIRAVLGHQAQKVILKAKGFDPSPVEYNQTIQSISQSKTYAGLSSVEEIEKEIHRMTKLISERAKKKNTAGKLVSISIRTEDFKSLVRSISLADYTSSYDEIVQNALMLFEQHYNGKVIKLLGVGLGSLILEEDKVEQLSIFDRPVIDIKEQLNAQIKGANLIYLKDLKQDENK